MRSILTGTNAQEITKDYGLERLLASGSSADIYSSGGDSIHRLSTDAGSHNLLVSGSYSKYAFPLVHNNYGAVGVSDDDSEDYYWLLSAEKCFHYDPLDERYTAFASALLKVDDLLQESDPADHKLARRLIMDNSRIFRELDLMSTMLFIVEYAAQYSLNIDVHPSNFMLNQEGDIVAVDPVFGPDPAVFG